MFCNKHYIVLNMFRSNLCNVVLLIVYVINMFITCNKFFDENLKFLLSLLVKI